jgi:hypothetical protein
MRKQLRESGYGPLRPPATSAFPPLLQHERTYAGSAKAKLGGAARSG